ncbi:hypothetical protein FB562_0754 [Homoserinimonas aerilata]|uniref:Uncharacterized protein n=2 Tax=Homoserinimonas aerilata TaxID=1162970 RepID=A0A542YI08_9MICO|nr:hypothetical protein FB562_0754 [Homoserinimonas aerilata]
MASLLGMTGTFGALDAASPREVTLYLVVGVVAGALFGLAASVVDSDRWQYRTFAAGVLGGVITGEGLYGIAVVDVSGPQWWLELTLGLLIAALIGRGWMSRMLSLGTAAIVALSLLSAYALYDAAMLA